MNHEFWGWIEKTYGMSERMDGKIDYRFSIEALESAWNAGAKSAETRAHDVDDLYRGRD